MEAEQKETRLSDRDYERVLTSVKSDARKIKDALDRMGADWKRLNDDGTHMASADILYDCMTTMRVGLRQLGDVFKVQF